MAYQAYLLEDTASGQILKTVVIDKDIHCKTNVPYLLSIMLDEARKEQLGVR